MQYMTVLAAALLVGIFVLDLLTPLGYAVWILYFVPILIASKTVRSRYFYVFPTIGTLLTIISLFMPFPTGDPKPVIARRIIGIFTIWAVTLIVGQRRKAELDLEKLSHELESRVEERTRELTQANIALHMEMNERKQAEEASIRAKEEWEGTFDSVPDLIAILDDQQRIVRVNRAMAERLGMQPEECKGLPCYTVIHHTENIPESCPHAEMLADGREHRMEVREASLGGDFLVTTTPLIGADGKMRAVHVARDITEQKRAADEIERLNTDLAARAAELEAANLELEAFNYTVAHDLRNPLNIINGYCQIMQQVCGEKLDDACRGYLQQAYDGTLRMNQLITALLNFSRMAHAEVHRERFDISALAQAAATELKQSEPQRRVTFRIPEGIVVDGDRDLLRVVLNNLLGNAWKYTAMRSEAMIEFGITEIDSNLAYFVHDNGPGFDTADAPQLFTPFKRLARAQEYRGFGIGLATVARIIQRHGGKVWAEGKPGRGAIFYFTLGK